MPVTYEQLARMIDHSLLHPTLTEEQLRQGCELAKQYQVATVCIKPYAVPMAAELLRGSGVGVGTVAGFPHGSEPVEIKRRQIEWAAQAGAKEIDVVVNIGKVLSHDWNYVEQEVQQLCHEAHQHQMIFKLIIETDYLPSDDLKITLCRIGSAAGVDFMKTSTGFGFVRGEDGRYFYRGATEHDVRLLRSHCPPQVQIKAAGGIRTLEALLRMRELGVSRCGMTATKQVLDAFREKFGMA